jgi:hypothetical protein
VIRNLLIRSLLVVSVMYSTNSLAVAICAPSYAPILMSAGYWKLSKRIPDDTFLVNRGEDGNIVILADFIKNRAFVVDRKRNDIVSEINIPRGEELKEISLQPKGKHIFVVTNFAYRIYDRTTGQMVTDLNVRPDMRFSSLANNATWSPDGSMLMYPERENKALVIYRPEDGYSVRIVDNRFRRVDKYTWSPDSTLVAVLDSSNAVHIFSRTGEELKKISLTYFQHYFYLTWTNPKTLIASNAFHREVWSLETGIKVAEGFSGLTSGGGRGVYNFKNAMGEPVSDIREYGVADQDVWTPVNNPFGGTPSTRYTRVNENILVFEQNDVYRFTDNNGSYLFSIAFAARKSMWAPRTDIISYHVEGKILRVIRADGMVLAYEMP